ncbi:MAG: DNA recombination protein RmuC [Oscillospiraceae bacterium]|nr:DNA recombination protein RmuC [Oscillospiraceae bacterium]
MEYVAPVLSALSLIISIVLLIVVLRGSKTKDGGDLAVIKEKLNSLSADQKGSQSELRKEVTDNIGQLSRMLSENQKQSAESMNQRLGLLEQRLQGIEKSNSDALNTVRETVNRQLLDIKEDNGKQLDKIRVTVDEKLQKTLEEKMTLSFKSVSERLEQVHKGLGEMQSLALGVGDLKKVLSNVKNRGILGEIQLGNILSDILTPEQYDTDVAVIPDSAARVEFAVKLPGDGDRPVYLPIDSKFPGDAYSALQEAYDTADKAEVEKAMKALVTRIKGSAKDIHDKYIKPPHTTNFGIMFLPFEGLYAEVVNQGLVEELQREYQVNIAGPSTMAAMLNSLQMGFRTLAIQKRSDEVWQVLSAVKGEFEKFAEALRKAQDHMRLADEDLNKLIGTRTNTINRSLRSVTALEGGLDSLVDIIRNGADDEN